MIISLSLVQWIIFKWWLADHCVTYIKIIVVLFSFGESCDSFWCGFHEWMNDNLYITHTHFHASRKNMHVHSACEYKHNVNCLTNKSFLFILLSCQSRLGVYKITFFCLKIKSRELWTVESSSWKCKHFEKEMRFMFWKEDYGYIRCSAYTFEFDNV